MGKLQLRPGVAGLFESIRGFKYSFHQAISDLTDNSADADSNIVELVFTVEDQIRIQDDGHGMDRDELEKAVTPWRTAGEKKKLKGKKGKYGIGLKSAGFSLADEIHIHTKRKGGTFFYTELKLEELKKMTKSDDDKINFSSKETNLWKDSGLVNGTIIQLKKINKRKVRPDTIDNLKNKLGMSFFGMIESGDFAISIDTLPVESLNPLLPSLGRNARQNHYRKFPPKIVKLKDDDGKEISFKCSAAYTGRGGHWTENERKRFRIFGKIGAAKHGGFVTHIKDQGLYISRNGRLITLGGWFGTRAFSHHHSPCRILIELTDEADHLIGVDHTKTKPEFESYVTDGLNQRYINKIFVESEKLYRVEGDEFRKERQEGADKEIKESAKGIKPTPVDLLMQKEAIISKAMPEYQKIQERLDMEIEQELEDEWWGLKDRLPYDVLWAPKMNKEGEVTVLLNESHPGYPALFYEDDEDKVRRNLNQFFWVLASYEAHFSELVTKLSEKNKIELKKQLEAYRRYVSKHFREFD